MPQSLRIGGVLCVGFFAVIALGGLSSEPPPSEPKFIPLGDLPGGMFTSSARAVTPDGTVAVGAGWSAVPRQPIRWTSAEGMTNLGKGLDLSDARANAVSADGAVIVGEAVFSSIEYVDGVPHPTETRSAFRWTQTNGLVRLDAPGKGGSSSAEAVTADGQVIVGSFEPRGPGSATAGTWTAATGWVALNGPYPKEDSDDDAQTWAHGVSSDGSVIVGMWADPDITSDDGKPVPRAFRWTKADGIKLLEPFPGGRHPSDAFAVSADGTTIIGTASTADGTFDEAFRWTAKDGAAGLGDLPGGQATSRAFGVSGDGSIIVGVGYTDKNDEAFIWGSVHGMRNLREVFAGAGVSDMEDWHFITAYGISPNGRFIVGYGTNAKGEYEAFLLDVGHKPL